MYRKLSIDTASVHQTRQFAAALGRLLEQGLLLALYGDLGSGKTAFVQGLAQGLEVPAEYYVSSPSYTLINEYAGRLKLFHVDLYRLKGALEASGIGLDEILDQAEAGVHAVAIEWAERLEGEDLGDHLSVDFRITAEPSRTVTLRAHGPRSEDLLKQLGKVKFDF